MQHLVGLAVLQHGAPGVLVDPDLENGLLDRREDQPGAPHREHDQPEPGRHALHGVGERVVLAVAADQLGVAGVARRQRLRAHAVRDEPRRRLDVGGRHGRLTQHPRRPVNARSRVHTRRAHEQVRPAVLGVPQDRAVVDGQQHRVVTLVARGPTAEPTACSTRSATSCGSSGSAARAAARSRDRRTASPSAGSAVSTWRHRCAPNGSGATGASSGWAPPRPADRGPTAASARSR